MYKTIGQGSMDESGMRAALKGKVEIELPLTMPRFLTERKIGRKIRSDVSM